VALSQVVGVNVNGVNGRLPRLTEWLDDTRPDVVCLQEIKTADATLNPVLARRLQATGVDIEYRGRQRPSDHAPTWVTVS
jgi:exodeoxyribonuclease-3